MKVSVTYLLVLPLAGAFSAPSMSVRPPFPLPNEAEPTKANKHDNQHSLEPTAVTSTPWRVVLDIGREPLASMPFDWARSGCRLPLVIPCDFRSDQSVSPRSETISFTGPGGAVVKPIEGGDWTLSDDKKQFSLSLAFPEYMERRDVWIDAETPITLQGRIFTQEELDSLNLEFYAARDEAWKLGEELNDIAKQKYGPKKWNEEEQVWERRTDGVPSIFSQAKKRIALMAAQANQRQKAEQRPSPNDLSERGSLPGIESKVYIQKQGAIKIGNGKNAVIGRWTAEPLSDRQASYYAQM